MFGVVNLATLPGDATHRIVLSQILNNRGLKSKVNVIDSKGLVRDRNKANKFPIKPSYSHSYDNQDSYGVIEHQSPSSRGVSPIRIRIYKFSWKHTELQM